ncbi:putative sulfoacetate transporter SauU [Paraburkholderia nemoris]|uniref:MFS transporter n=1 Tax=Paraburkholderia nemoris TaxID=2793076 RepID=UPI001909D829|nr:MULTISPECIES: MFS transporter [Paraburkholderia]MBK3780625.1 MFS transporter [Paraburkholderia aspalathi]CAE6793612.1 putative sulfoacetate transporter SauU [Paraburkholderia nemoris]
MPTFLSSTKRCTALAADTASAYPTQARETAQGRRWVIVASLFLFMLINFADKAVLGLVAIPLMHDMQLTHSQFGLVGSAFFLLFSISGIAVGLIVDRVNMKWLLAALALIWAVAQLPLAWPTGFAVLLLCRVLLGAGEGPASPLALHVVYTWFDDHERNLPTAIVQQGATAGVIIAGPLLTYISQQWHWHATFLTLGAVGIGWTALWLCLGKTGNRQHNPSPAFGATATGPRAASLRFRRMLSDRTVIGVMLQCFVGYAVIAIGFTWVPAYFRLGLGFGATQAGWLFALQVAAQIPLGIALAMASHPMLKRGVPSKVARGKLISAACVVSGLAYCSLLFGAPPFLKVALMGLASALAIQTFTFGPMLVAEVAPAARRGALLAITNSIVTTAGLIGPIAMGKLLGAAGDVRGYEIGFAVTGTLLLIVGTAGFALIDPQRSKRRMEGTPG